jgi:membrane-bound lytic murein transglycosylase B
MGRQGVWVFLCCVSFFLFPFQVRSADTLKVPDALLRALEKKGISKKVLISCYSKSPKKVDLGIILKNVTHKEVMADYTRFLNKKTILKTGKYLKKNKVLFVEIEKTYRVPKEVVASILMVESSFGENGGKYSVFSVYTSLASLLDGRVRKAVREKASRAGEDVKAKRFGRRIARKAKWGMKELLCLIRLSEQGKVDLARLKGSWAGAFGMPQFVPTSFEAYGVDWDGDGRVDLDTLSDAAASVSNYLKKHGWKKSLAHKKALRVIKYYNLSQPYATTILKLAESLKKGN